MNILIFLLISMVVAAVKSEYFSDIPPRDYFNRKTLADCPSRFYSDLDRFGGYGIFGGLPARLGEFQHMAAIGWRNEKGVRYLCGGTLISAKFVLTAAHCRTDGNENKPVSVRLGDVDLGDSSDDQFAQEIPIRELIVHPQYLSSMKYFDIALIELEQEVKFNQAVCAACLWMENEVPEEKLQAVGFGATGFGDNLSPQLLKTQLSTITNQNCSGRLPEGMRSFPQGLVQEQFCAIGEKADSCEGDSGGPIQTERSDVNNLIIPLVVGVVSFGTPCGVGSTGVYTRISSYKSWIEQITGQPFDHLTCARISKCHDREMKYSNMQKPPKEPIHRVGLLWNATDLNQYRCGATLVDYRHAITSAQCVFNRPGGAPKFIVIESTGELVPVENIRIHPEYNRQRPENDLALIKLTKYLKADAELLPACLWRDAEVKEEYNSIFYSAYSSRFTADLARYNPDANERYVIKTKLENNAMCKDSQYRSRNLLCGESNSNLIPKVCKIDYGGPVSNIQNAQYLPQLYGVVSSLTKECDGTLVGTRIAPHINWIEDTILDQSSDQLIFST
ncbi:polyserase-2-like [Uranotaenia lowii]|uniref:polyserase-2-like n=1 Tax=Uranotaenia lowii TaxID=190385 RepID=UPI00247A2557|nr:polyserase-2-like [Uranotaenia lowii]